MVPMAQGATIYTFSVSLSDVDRSVYESLELKVARHASETLDYLVTRVLAYCLEHAPGIAFTKGLGEGDEPAIWIHDLSGQLVTWIEVGSPAPAKVHRASKAARRVAIYAHRNAELVREKLAAETIHRAEEIPIYSFDRAFLDGLSAAVDRRTVLDVSVTDRHVYVSVGGKTFETPIAEHRLGPIT
jgi:uncharacterized protein YaeQ